MIDDLDLLYLQAPVGKGQENNPDDIEALDGRLRKVGAYAPPPEYADSPQRYATEPMIDALERFQEQNGLKIDAVAKPGGPTERAINNALLKKPRGAGLLYDPPTALAGTVGNGFENRREDVISVQRRLGALNYLPEDPFDKPHGFIDENTTNGIKEFQRAKRLVEDGRLAPRGETERALDGAVADLARAKAGEWFSFLERAGRAQESLSTKLASPPFASPPDDSRDYGDVVLARTDPIIIRPAPVAPNSSVRLPPSLQSRRPTLIEIDPQHVPPPRPDRYSGPPPRDLKWDNALRSPNDLRRGPGIHLPFPRNPNLPSRSRWEPVQVEDIERALRREPPPAVDKLKTYLPEPGSPLGIPILDFNPFGSPGDPRTVELNQTLAKAIEEGCKEAMPEAEVTHFAGPGSTKKKERAVQGKEGRSYPDTETRIEYKGVKIRIFGDSYTPRADRMPDSREQRQFARLDRNAEEHNRVYVRLPKTWMIGEEINPEKLKEFTRELCREVKQAVDEGRLGDGKDKLRLEKLFEELTKRKKARGEGPEAPAPDTNQPRP